MCIRDRYLVSCYQVWTYTHRRPPSSLENKASSQLKRLDKNKSVLHKLVIERCTQQRQTVSIVPTTDNNMYLQRDQRGFTSVRIASSLDAVRSTKFTQMCALGESLRDTLYRTRYHTTSAIPSNVLPPTAGNHSSSSSSVSYTHLTLPTKA